MIETYRPSGMFGATSFALAGGGAVAMAIAAWIYQLGIDWIPLIYASVLLTLGFAFVGMMGSGMVSTIGKVRNPILGAILGLAMGICGTAVSHYSGYTRFFENELESGIAQVKKEGQQIDEDMAREKFAEFLTFGKYIDIRVESGWSIGRVASSSDGGAAPISGIFVWLIWLIELGIIASGCAVGGYQAAEAPFCEMAGEWADEEEVIWTRDDISGTDITRLGGANELRELWEIEPADGPAQAAVTWSLNRTPSGQGATFLTVSKLWVEVDDKGESEVKTEAIVAHALVEPSDVDALIAARDSHTAAAEAAAADGAEEPDES